MIPAVFDYKKAATVEEALALLASDEVKILAGGQSLIPSLKLRLNRPSLLVDIANIPSLKGVREEDGEIVIGAGTTHHEIEVNPLIQSRLSFFSETASEIGDPAIRNRGTIGGSLAHADPASDWPAPVLAAESVIEVQGPKGKRKIMAQDFFKGLFSTALNEDEIILAVRVPVPVNGSRSGYKKFSQPASRFAIAGCAVMQKPDKQYRIAFNGVSNHAFRDYAAEKVLAGQTLDAGVIAEAVKAAVEGQSLMQDYYASQSFRKHLAKVILKKTLESIQ